MSCRINNHDEYCIFWRASLDKFSHNKLDADISPAASKLTTLGIELQFSPYQHFLIIQTRRRNSTEIKCLMLTQWVSGLIEKCS